MKLANTNTLSNLIDTFTEKSINHVIYDIYAKRAGVEGYDYIRDIYHEISENERHNARAFYERLCEGGVEQAAGSLSFATAEGDTLANLSHSMRRCEDMSGKAERFYHDAKQEGFAEIAALYKVTLESERNNVLFFEALYNRLQTNKIYKNENTLEWRCDNCGQLHQVCC